MMTVEQKSKRQAIRALGKEADKSAAVRKIIDSTCTDITLAKEAFATLRQINTPEAILAHGEIVKYFGNGTLIQHDKKMEKCVLDCIASLGEVDKSHSEDICRVISAMPKTEKVTLKALAVLIEIKTESAVNLIDKIKEANAHKPAIWTSSVLALHKMGTKYADEIVDLTTPPYKATLPLLEAIVSHYETGAYPHRPKEAKKIVTACTRQLLGNLSDTFDIAARNDKGRKKLCCLFERAHDIGLMADPAAAIEIVEKYKQLKLG